MIFKELKRLLRGHYLLWTKRLKENKEMSLLALNAESFYHAALKRFSGSCDIVILVVARRVMSSWKEWKRKCDKNKKETDIASLHYNKQLINKVIIIIITNYIYFILFYLVLLSLGLYVTERIHGNKSPQVKVFEEGHHKMERIH